jgi:hypothetical protein
MSSETNATRIPDVTTYEARGLSNDLLLTLAVFEFGPENALGDPVRAFPTNNAAIEIQRRLNEWSTARVHV